ncbi:MAG: ATP-dependent DNA helicase RecG [Bacilli bacterium]
MKNTLLSQIEYITPKQISYFKKCNILTVEDLLLNFPSKFDDYTIVPIKDAQAGVSLTIAGVVQSKATVTSVKTKLSVMNFYIDADGQKIRVSIFNRHFLKSRLFYGVYVRLTGKFSENMKSFTASEIHFEELGNNINPVFGIKGITDAKVLEIKEKVFEDYGDKINDILPSELLEKYQLISYHDALKFINIPENTDEINQAIKRIKFEELFLYQTKIKYMFYMRKHFPQGVAINYDETKVKNFIDHLPFKLTVDQNKALEDILGDMRQEYKMNRLLQGEVGSGKTVVAAICLYAAITAGYQGALMVPTEVLAQQHYQTFLDLFKNEPVTIAMLSSSIASKDKKFTLSGLADKKVDIVIGTHSLFQKDVEFEHLGLVVTDEEHRFGVKQRVSIIGKGNLIDHLKMSATPIPRTLAISILGETDISIIKTMPGRKKPVITKYLSENDLPQVVVHMKEELARNHQIYVITPMIEESEVMDLRNTTEIFEKVSSYFNGICEVGLIHSRLKPQEKEQVMKLFTENQIQILVSTSVIEVGVNIVNATTMIIFNADRFGIAQLHQMRGRVRRSDEQAYCFLISDTTIPSAIARLKLVEENSDGFVLAEEDLIIRGPGDFFGEKQSGTVAFKMADLVLDKDLLITINQESEAIINNGKLFNDQQYQEVLKIVKQNYDSKKEMLD